MVNLMIVDDEIHVVKDLRSDLDIDKLGITNVYEALNIRQAKEIFRAKTIHILLCDIEMPQGSGLELLEWVNGHHPGVPCIFLTSHAEFKYAKQALQLGSLDYLLKPIPVQELEEVILKAIEQVHKRDEMQRSTTYQQLLKKQQPLVMEKFWLDLLSHTIPSNVKQIQEYAERYHLPLTEQMMFIPILLGVQRWHKELNVRDERVMEYALKKSAEELLLPTDRYGQILEWRRGLFFAVVLLDGSNEDMLESLKNACETYIASCNRYFNCDLSCYIGTEALTNEITEVVERLLILEENNVSYDNKVFLLGGTTNKEPQVALPDMTVWSTMLKNGTQKKVKREVSEYLYRLVQTEGLNAKLLHQFRHDFLQMIYFVLNLKGIQAHRLYSDDTSTDLFAEATRSVTDMMEWVHHMIERAFQQTDAVNKSHEVIEKVKQYIGVHLDKDDLAREEIASEVCLHPDYLSRLFKKVSGQSITDYILHERIKVAKELLNKTEMTVAEVASSVGYYNFSHFTKMFKKNTGLSPKDYRKKMS